MGAQEGSTEAVAVKTESARISPSSDSSGTSPNDSEGSRGRKQERDSSLTPKADPDGEHEDGVEGDALVNGKPRKRKRSRKGLEKNFPCNFPDCGKSYSRAEHLYRHQLNHTRKKIYACDYPSCERTFVRQDLCTRHRERHTARGSNLQRKEVYAQDTGEPILSPIGSHHSGTFSGYPTPMGTHMGMASGLPQINTTPYGTPLNHGNVPQPQHSPLQQRMTDSSNPSPSANRMMSPVSYHTAPNSAFGTGPMGSRANSLDTLPGQMPHRMQDPPIARSATSSSFEPGTRYGNHGEPRFPRPMTTDPRNARPNSFPSGNTPGWNPSPTSSYAALPSQGISNGAMGPDSHGLGQRGQTGFMSHPGMPPQMSLPPPVTPIPTPARIVNQLPQSRVPNTASDQVHYSSGPMDISTSMNGSINNFEPENMRYSQDYAPNSGFRSPYIMSEDFLGFLFNEGDGSNGIPVDPEALMGANPMPRDFIGLEDDPMNNNLLENMPTPDPMAVTAILDRQQNETLSEANWRELSNFVLNRFNETNHELIKAQKEALLQGNHNDSSHPMSHRMMKTYIGSYWYHFHPQMPILHRPTFSADKTNTLLLIAIIAIGASCLDKEWGSKVINDGAELSNFFAWHLRGEIFQHKDFRSPAELWVFQTLLLLEVYEKMYSTRALHERAHIHHGTTLTLMRRGRSFIGRSALDSPPLIKGEGTNNKHGGSGGMTPDEWWHQWIETEGVRRTAFAAFIIDSLHATMFGHSAVMVAHELKVQLPCDESLWSATSSVEVGKLEAELAHNGVKPINFCDGLKATLNCQSVRTNAFGRTALMAGALNVSWHLNQRDTQARSLGSDIKALAGQNKWRTSLMRAYDFWHEDFEGSVQESSSTSTSAAGRNNNNNNNNATSSSYQPSASARRSPDDDNLFESKTVSHHLAHMAMHMDIVSCQIFAQAERLLGRTTLPSDKSNARKRIVGFWVPRASARDATWYSLKFLKEVLLPRPVYDPLSGRLISPVPVDESTAYSARDDYLLNRPWVLYYAALIVWSYGYARHGCVQNPPSLITYRDKAMDMYTYLERVDRVGGIEKPDDLVHLQDLNRCLGMLWILRSMFEKCRWELLHEAAKLLGNCIGMLDPQGAPEGAVGAGGADA